MTTAASGTPGADPMPESPAALEAEIERRRNHLAATIDELTTRASPKDIARRGAAGLQQRLRSITHTPEGEVRTERLIAVAVAVAALGGALIYLSRRRR